MENSAAFSRVLTMAAVFFTASVLCAQETTSPASSPNGPVTTEWLADSANARSVKIIDARTQLTPYVQGHIPDAVYLNVETLRLSKGGVPAQLQEPEVLANIFGQIGINHSDRVVVYSSKEDHQTAASYVATVLQYLGVKQAAVLDGGFDKWQNEQRVVQKDFPRMRLQKFEPTLHKEVLSSFEKVKEFAAGTGDVQILDARPPEQHAQGKIPSSKNVPIKSIIDPETNTWRSPEQIRQELQSRGIDPSKPIITYCNSGREASVLGYALKNILGFKDVSVYDGSIIDWKSRGEPTPQSNYDPTNGTVAPVPTRIKQ